MPRPKLRRRVRFYPRVRYFKPQGVPMRVLQVIELSRDELEALRLKNEKELDQIACAQKMGVSQSTLQRTLSSAYRKVTKALVRGMAIRISE
jgi:predicted DNA-binding protein (UPF0251 family)